MPVVKVTRGPGEASQPHSHPCPVVGYVTEGAMRMQVKGEREAVYRAGQAFYEAPGGVHLVSRNTSDERTARFIGLFLCDRDGAPSVKVDGRHDAGVGRP